MDQNMVDDLKVFRQQSMERFVASGGKRKDHDHLTLEAETFCRDGGLITHPLYTTCIKHQQKAKRRDLVENISCFIGDRLKEDEISFSAPITYTSRQNKYGISCIAFDHDGALFAVGGSNGMIRVYDFDQTYSLIQLSSSESAVAPAVQFDTRRDISCIAWSHLNPDDIAVAYLLRPEIHVFDLGEVEEDPQSGSECSPRRVLETESKSSSGNNVVLYWHSVKRDTVSSGGCVNRSSSGAARAASKRDCEGVLAGSVSGYIRFWNTSTSNNKNFLWSVLADPQRTALTASAVASMVPIEVNRDTAGSDYLHCSHDPLLLVATVQGVMTIWDLSVLKPVNFGSTQPGPLCLRRVDYMSQLMLLNSTVISVCAAHPNTCGHCLSKASVMSNKSKYTSASSSTAPNYELEWLQGCVDVCNMSNNKRKHTGNQDLLNSIDDTILVTLSTGAVKSIELRTNEIKCLHSGHSSTADIVVAQTGQNIPTIVNNDPRVATVVNYDQLRREITQDTAAASAASNNTLRAVLPAIVTVWDAPNRTHLVMSEQQNVEVQHVCDSALARSLSSHCEIMHSIPPRASGYTVFVCEPTNSGEDSLLLGLSVDKSLPAVVYPHMHSNLGTCSISGKDYDTLLGRTRSNMRCNQCISTTLPGHIISVVSGGYEVMCSQDLQDYVCAEVGARSSYSKTCEIAFDWTYAEGLMGHVADPEELAVCGPDGLLYTSTCSTNTATQVSSHRIILANPYVGPSVLDGEPYVRIRAALLPSGRTAEVSVAGASSASFDKNNAQLPLMKRIIPSKYTALSAHPTYPILVAGTLSDKVIVLTPFGTSIDKEEKYEHIFHEQKNGMLPACNEDEFTLSSSNLLKQGTESWRRVLPVREGEDENIIIRDHETQKVSQDEIVDFTSSQLCEGVTINIDEIQDKYCNIHSPHDHDHVSVENHVDVVQSVEVSDDFKVINRLSPAPEATANCVALFSATGNLSTKRASGVEKCTVSAQPSKVARVLEFKELNREILKEAATEVSTNNFPNANSVTCRKVSISDGHKSTAVVASSSFPAFRSVLPSGGSGGGGSEGVLKRNLLSGLVKRKESYPASNAELSAKPTVLPLKECNTSSNILPKFVTKNKPKQDVMKSFSSKTTPTISKPLKPASTVNTGGKTANIKSFFGVKK